MVAYKRLKTIENHQPSGPKRGRGRLQGGWSFTRVTNSKALTGKMLVFMIGGGRTWRFDFISGFCKLC